MCGIVGLYLKNPDWQAKLGTLFSPMLEEMTERGPDSAGFAIYRGDTDGRAKLSLYSADPGEDWLNLAETASAALNCTVTVDRIASHGIARLDGAAEDFRHWLAKNRPGIRVMSAGNRIEIYKEIGLPKDVLSRFGAPQMIGSHAIGHTRMATESAVTTEGAHPFNTGDDLCLVHNGSLSNHHRLRRWLEHQAGIPFQTDNDSEVAAGYLTWRLREGASIREALEAALKDLDGFYTFAVGTRDGFSVLRDPIACKPAVMAETDDWVAMASEFRSIAQLPGVEGATVWEPKPATVYSWGHA